MNKDEFISEVSNNKEYKSICKKLLKFNPLWKDLYQELIIILLEYPEEKFNTIKCQRCFVVGILYNMVFSSTSPFHKKYRSSNFVELNGHELYDINQFIDSIDKSEQVLTFLNEESNYNKELFKVYSELGSYRNVQKETGIHYREVHRIVNKVKKNLKNKMKPVRILMIMQNKITGLQYHRQITPHERLLKTNPSEVKITKTSFDGDNPTIEPSIDHFTDELLKEFDIVYYLRQISFESNKVEPTINRLHSLGIKVILDIDDYWDLPESHELYDTYKKSNVSTETIKALKSVDLIITTTDYFRDIIYQYNDNVIVIPNCISPDDKQFKIREICNNRTRIGWIGGVYHQKDFEMITPLFSHPGFKTKELKDKYQFCLGGFTYTPLQEQDINKLSELGCNIDTIKYGRYDEIVKEVANHGAMVNMQPYMKMERIMTDNYNFAQYDKPYFEYCMTMTPVAEHISFDKTYRRLYGRDIRTYGELYNEVDVCLAPLTNNTFNNCKSELKIVEAGYMAKPVIVSPAPQYSNWIENGVNGFIANNPIEWFAACRKLILNPSMRKEMGLALQETIHEYFDMDTHNKARLEAYRNLIQ